MSLPSANSVNDGIRKDPLTTFSKPTPSALSKLRRVELTNVEYIGSYNWIERKMPSILVPGSPNHWVDKRMPFKLPKDVGVVTADQNNYRMPGTPLLPLIVAVNVKSGIDIDSGRPNFDWPSVDLVTDRNNLRKILRWVNARPGDSTVEFRVDLQLAGKKTVLMNRFSKNPREMASAGSGHNFEEAMTMPAPQCEEGVGHHRIIQYDFNGLKTVVRFEVDACLPSSAAPRAPSHRATSSTSINDLTNAFAGVSVQAKTRLSEVDATFHSGVAVYSAGSWSIPQSSILEMTTRSFRNYEAMNWSEVFPQLYLSQTPNLFIGLHRQGTFTNIVREKLNSQMMKQIHEAEQPKMKALRWVLGAVQDLLVKNGPNARLSLVCVDGVLGVYERMSDEDCLPEAVLEYFDAL